MRPRQWITPLAAALRTPRVHTGRSHVERRALAARRTVHTWVTSGSNAERVGDGLAAHHRISRRPGGHTLADYVVLLEEWGVPGIAAPSDLTEDEASRWSRSVTLVVVRHLQRQGRLPPTSTDHGPHPRLPAPPEGLRYEQDEGISPRAGASPAPTKVASMAELPHPPPARNPEPAQVSPVRHDLPANQFPPVDLRVEGRSLHVQRLDAQAAVDLARQQSILARHALLSGPASADAADSRAAADDASTVLRAAVDVLTALDVDGAASHGALDIDLEVDGTTVVARPHGELDLFTSPRLERACVERLDGGAVDVLVVDLSAVAFLDSSALAVLVEIQRVCQLGTTRFAITGLTGRTRRLLAITRLDTVLDVI